MFFEKNILLINFILLTKLFGLLTKSFKKCCPNCILLDQMNNLMEWIVFWKNLKFDFFFWNYAKKFGPLEITYLQNNRNCIVCVQRPFWDFFWDFLFFFLFFGGWANKSETFFKIILARVANSAFYVATVTFGGKLMFSVKNLLSFIFKASAKIVAFLKKKFWHGFQNCALLEPSKNFMECIVFLKIFKFVYFFRV